MMSEAHWVKRLNYLLIVTFVSSILHYVDNILYFSLYPEPVWIHPSIVDLFWFVMTPLALLGALWISAGYYKAATVMLVLYGLCNMLTLGHYNYAAFSSIGLKIHLFILLEAGLGAVLIGYVLWPWAQKLQGQRS